MSYSSNLTISYLPNNLHTKTNIWATQLEHYIDSTVSAYGKALISLHYILCCILENYLRFSILNIDIIYHIKGIGHDLSFVKVLDLSSMALTLSSPGPDGDTLKRLQVNLTLRI